MSNRNGTVYANVKVKGWSTREVELLLVLITFSWRKTSWQGNSDRLQTIIHDFEFKEPNNGTFKMDRVNQMYFENVTENLNSDSHYSYPWTLSQTQLLFPILRL